MKYIDAEKLRSEVERVKETECASPILVCDDILTFIDYLLEEQSKSRLIQVKCIHPHDESWEKDKVYTCEIWHHGDMNMDFYDVYYDYGNNPNYVQFTNIKMLNEEFIILQQEQPEDISLIKHWFEHIAQIADDRKTLTGEVMEDSYALDEIKSIAKNSIYYIEHHAYTKEKPLDEDFEL